MAFDPSRESQISEEHLKWGYWWTTHRVRVRQGFSIALAVVDFALVAFALFGFADWFFGSGVTERQSIGQLAQSVIDYGYFRELHAPQDLRLDPALVLSAGEKKYDFVARVENPNTEWIANLDYHFETTGGATASQHAVLIPGQVRWLDNLGTSSDAAPSSATAMVENLRWQRVNKHLTQPDYATWAAQRLNFGITDVAFVPPSPADAIAVSRARFTVTNDTGFGYYQVGFYVTLISNSRVVGVNKVTISRLMPGEKRVVETSWFQDIPQVSRVEVQPVLNIFDEQLYIAPGQ